MKKLIFVLALGALVWQAHNKYHILPFSSDATQLAADDRETQVRVRADSDPPAASRCDGRTHCSQMTSCAEATYFLRNCPGVQMDGDNDGIPCERQWC